MPLSRILLKSLLNMPGNLKTTLSAFATSFTQSDLPNSKTI